MKVSVNLKTVQKFFNKKYDDCFDYVTLALANALTKNLKKIIERRGLNPDQAPEPRFYDLLQGAVEQGLQQKRAVVPFHFLGGNYVSNPDLNPIKRSRLDFLKKQEELAKLSSEGDLSVTEDSLKLLVPLFNEEPPKEVILEIQDETVPMPRKHPRKPVKNRRSKKAAK